MVCSSSWNVLKPTWIFLDLGRLKFLVLRNGERGNAPHGKSNNGTSVRMSILRLAARFWRASFRSPEASG